MDTKNLCHLLLGTDQFVIRGISVRNREIRVAVVGTAERAQCPVCQVESSEVHSTYSRFPSDLAWAEWGIVLHLLVRRFFCRNEQCAKRTFAEQFPGVVSRYARRTDRVVARQRHIGVEVCAQSAERLLRLMGIGISDTTLNRVIRAIASEPAILTRVLGVDDWAKRKGQNYGTVLVDLERSEIVDLLADRTAETLIEWLKKHPGIEIVTRDRSQTYADAIQKGAPQAIQVADRWHLLKNLSDVVFKILQQEYDVIKTCLTHDVEQEKSATDQIELSEAAPAVELQALTQAEQRRKERMEQTQRLLQRGWSQKDIAHHLNIHPKTVRRYLQNPSPHTRRRRTGHLLDAFKPYLLKRWNEGCHNATRLYREIQRQGFVGKSTTVRDFVRRLRHASGLPLGVRCEKGKLLDSDPTKRPPTLRSLTWYIVRRTEEQTIDDELLLARISERHAKLTATIKLARAFARIVREQEAEKLDDWLRQARHSGIRNWRNFAAGLDQDYDAVRASLALKWSNGPTEGHINRLKCLKRQMYGRAKDDLLRKRVLWQGRWSFT